MAQMVMAFLPIQLTYIMHKLKVWLIAHRNPYFQIDTRSEQMSMNVNANISNECDWIKYVNPFDGK